MVCITLNRYLWNVLNRNSPIKSVCLNKWFELISTSWTKESHTHLLVLDISRFSLLILIDLFSHFLCRYILIAYHHLYAQIYRPHIIVLQLLIVWGFAFLTMVPPALGIWGTLGLDESTFSCTILKKDGRSIKKFLFLVGFLLPCVVIITSYTCIYYIVRRQRQKMSGHLQGGSIGKTTVAIATAREREDSRLTAMMLTIFICFIACFLPLTVVNIVDDKNDYPWLNIISSILAWASSVINPFIYAASNRTYRVAYFKLFAALKFWGEPMSPMPSKSFLQSRGSKEVGSHWLNYVIRMCLLVLFYFFFFC